VLFEEQAGKYEPGSLAAREDLDFLLDQLAAKEEAAGDVLMYCGLVSGGA
jgi:hypothetical protein